MEFPEVKLLTFPRVCILAVILLSPAKFGSRRRFTGMHELSHVLLQSGIEAQLARHFGGEEEAAPYIEAWCNYAAGLLQLPAPLLREALRRYGHTPGAILHLQHKGRTSLAAALRRYVYDDPDASRAAFVTSGNYVYDVAALNCRLPFWRYDRLPEPHLVFEDATLLTLPGRTRTIGVLTP